MPSQPHPIEPTSHTTPTWQPHSQTHTRLAHVDVCSMDVCTCAHGQHKSRARTHASASWCACSVTLTSKGYEGAHPDPPLVTRANGERKCETGQPTRARRVSRLSTPCLTTAQRDLSASRKKGLLHDILTMMLGCGQPGQVHNTTNKTAACAHTLFEG